MLSLLNELVSFIAPWGNTSTERRPFMYSPVSKGMEEDTPSNMAYGSDEFMGAECPAMVSLGHWPHGPALTAAEAYDNVAEEHENMSPGVVDAETAEAYWNKAMEDLDGDALESAKEIRAEVFA